MRQETIYIGISNKRQLTGCNISNEVLGCTCTWLTKADVPKSKIVEEFGHLYLSDVWLDVDLRTYNKKSYV